MVSVRLLPTASKMYLGQAKGSGGGAFNSAPNPHAWVLSSPLQGIPPNLIPSGEALLAVDSGGMKCPMEEAQEQQYETQVEVDPEGEKRSWRGVRSPPKRSSPSLTPSHLPLIWISCPFLSHLISASGSASSTLRRILWPLLTW